MYKELCQWSIPKVINRIKNVILKCKTYDQLNIAELYSLRLLDAYCKMHRIKKHSSKYNLIEDAYRHYFNKASLDLI